MNKKISSGAAWTIFHFGSQKVIQLISNLILTRILFPEAFGLMALVNVFLVGLDMFSDLGLRAAVIQKSNGADKDFLKTAWTLQVIRGFGIFGVAVLLAWPISLFYGEPLLFPLIAAVSTTAMIKGFQSIGVAYTQRQIALGRMTAMELVSQVAAAVVMIIAAWQMNSVWALAVGTIFGAFVRVFLSHWLLPSHNAFLLHKKYMLEIFHFGKWIFGSTLLTFVGGRGLAIIQGKLAGVEVLAFITLATTLSWALGDLVSHILNKVLFPYLSRIQRQEPARFNVEFFKLRSIILALVIPGFCLLSFIAQPLIDLLYDERYALTGGFLAIMALGAGIGCLSMIYQNAILAKGETRTQFHFMVIFSVFRISGVVLGFYVAGVWGMLIGSAAAGFLAYLVSLFIAVRRGISMVLIDAVFVGLLGLAALGTYYLNFTPASV